jgi:hypothetical protein
MRSAALAKPLRKLARLRTCLALVPLLAGVAGCNAPDGPAAATRRPRYFDVKGALEQQIGLLTQQRAAVTKEVSLRDGAVETVRVPGVKWADELQVFFQADINKAALRGAYAVDSVALPNGRIRRTYTRLPGQRNAPVARLQVVQQAAALVGLTATITQNNPLFSTEKELQMSLQHGRLHRYGVAGTQKLVLFDTLRYRAAGRVE